MFVSTIIAKLRAYLRYRTARLELGQLSDRQLADIGINRAMINDTAWGSAQS